MYPSTNSTASPSRAACICPTSASRSDCASSTRPQGLGVGPRPLCGSCCVSPKVPASLVSRWFWAHILSAPVCRSCVAVSVWDIRSGSWTSRFLVSVILYHPPGKEALCFSKEPGIRFSAIFIGWGILDKRLHLSQT